MPGTAGQNLGLVRGWVDEEDGWGTPLNDDLNMLDGLVQIAVIDKDLLAPPGSSSDGDRYIVAGPTPTGLWAGHAGQVAHKVNGAWTFYPPKAGWTAFVIDEGALYVRSATAWSVVVGQAHLNANHFTSTQAAIDAIPIAGGSVYIPRGIYTHTVALYTPCDRPVHIYGERPTNIANVMQNAGTVLKWTANCDALRIRGNFSSVRNLMLWNTTGAVAADEESGRGITVGRRSIVDAHPHPGTSGTDTEVVKGSGDVFKGCLIEDVFVYRMPGWGLSVPGFGFRTNASTAEPGKIDTVTLSIWVFCNRTYITESQKFGNVFLGAGNADNVFDRCCIGAVGEQQVNTPGFYIYDGGSSHTVWNSCTIEGLDAGTIPWIKLYGTEDVVFRDCWIEEDYINPAVSNPDPGYFIHFAGFNRGGLIDSCHFARSAANAGRLRLIKIGASATLFAGANGIKIDNPMVTSNSAVVTAWGPPAVYIEAAHIDFGNGGTYKHGNRMCSLLGGIIWDQARGEVVPISVVNVGRANFVVTGNTLRVPGAADLTVMEGGEVDNGAITVAWSRQPGDAIGAGNFYWGGNIEGGWRLFNNVPNMTKAQRIPAAFVVGDIVWITDATAGKELQMKIANVGGGGAANWKTIPYAAVAAGPDY
jgi:hypothetical protein